MGTLEESIRLNDEMSNVLFNIIGAVDSTISAVDRINSALATGADTSSFEEMSESIANVREQIRKLTETEIPMPEWQRYEAPQIFTSVGADRWEQETAALNEQLRETMDIQSRITTNSAVSSILSPQAQYDIQNVENRMSELISLIERAQNSRLDIGTDAANNDIEALRGRMESIIELQNQLNEAMESGDTEQINAAYASLQDRITGMIRSTRDMIQEPVEIPVPGWQSDTSIEVFNSSGVERYRQEVGSLNDMMSQLAAAQERITQNAVYGNVLPPNAASDMININERIGAIQARIRQINANPANAVDPAARNEAENLRGQLNDMLQTQQRMNAAIENMDLSAANQEYLRLSGSVSNTERYIRDNVDEQGRFNRAVEQGTSSANKLMNALKGAVSVYAVIKGVKKALDFASDCTEKFNTQLNAENQLMTVLGNMLTADYVSEFKIQTSADTSGAVSDIQGLSNNIEGVEVPLSINKSAAANALQNEFDLIKAKASEIQGNGIYGDEAMIAGAAEFATYFTDVDAITTMMDTLSNYAMGMSGGGEIDSNAMVNYATGLGKIMSGSYDAMTKKGFEFSDAQKAVIEGTANEAQYIEVLGEGWRDMSDDMRSAAAITQVIDEGWGGLYEKMSSTPQGKIIQLSNAWGDMQETIGQRLYPAIISIVDLIGDNWDVIQGIADGAVEGITFIIDILGGLISVIMSIADFVQQNWDVVQPVLLGTAALLGVVAVAQLALNASMLAGKAAMVISTVAQRLFNSELLKCPLFWVAAAIIAAATALAIYTNKINKAYGLNLSFAGMLSGCVMVILAACGNLIIDLVNFFLLLGNIGCGVWEMLKSAFYNVYVFFNNAICDIQAWFWGLLSTVLTVVAKVGDALNKIPFVNIDTAGIKDKAAEFAEKEAEATGNKLEYEDAGAAFLKGMDTIDYLDRIDYNDAFELGYNWGAEVFGGSDTADYQADYMPAADDYLNTLNDIDDNTEDIKNGLDITDDELKYLRDIAEQEAINRFTTAEITIEQTNNNSVSSAMDLDGIVSGLTDLAAEAVEIISEGVHA